MKIVLFEYISSGMCESAPLYPELIKEADIMVAALGQGFVEAGCELVVFRAPSLPPLPFAAQVIPLTAQDDWHAALDEELHLADAYIPLAPESDAMLENICLKAQQTNCTLLNTTAQTVHKTADKRYTLKQLQAHGIPCVACDAIDDHAFPSSVDMVIKPNSAVACENTFLIQRGKTPTDEQRRHAQIYQPYLQGTAASLSVMYSFHAKPCILGVNRQEITIDEQGCFNLNACHVNALARLALDFEGLAAAVHKCFPKLLGYAGIDFIIHDDNFYVLEINPRVTTSFAGIAKTTGINPCAMLLAACYGEPLACPPRNKFTSYTIDVSDENGT